MEHNDVLTCRVSTKLKPVDPPCLMVEVGGEAGGSRFGRICVTKLAERGEWTDDPLKRFRHGQFLRCRVLKSRVPAKGKNDDAAQQKELSARPLDLSLDLEEDPEAEWEAANAVPQNGELVTGFVVRTTKKGCFVRTTRFLTCKCELRNLSNRFIENVAEEFPPGKLVAGRVLSSDKGRAEGKVEITLKPQAVLGDVDRKLALESIKRGDVMDGVVRGVKEFGVFVTLERGGLVGLAHVSELFDEDDREAVSKRKNLTGVFSPGDRVKCIILDVQHPSQSDDDDEKRKSDGQQHARTKISIGLKPSYFEGLDVSDVSASTEDEATMTESTRYAGTKSPAMPLPSLENTTTSAVIGAENNNKRARLAHAGQARLLTTLPPPASLQQTLAMLNAGGTNNMAGGRKRSNTIDSLLSTSSDPAVSGGGIPMPTGAHVGDDDDDDDVLHHSSNNKKSARRRKALKRKAEADIASREDRLARDAPPETSADFERLLVAEPNSSYWWIQYMAHALAGSDAEGARAIALRALDTISYREPEEKRNVWIALARAEVARVWGPGSLVGEPEERRAEDLLKRMVRENDPEWAWVALCDAYSEEAGNFAKAREAMRAARKATHQRSPSVWLRTAKLEFDAGEPGAGRRVLKQALEHLPRAAHVGAMMDFARLEFTHPRGDKERARSVLETVLENFPRRTDALNVYLDAEIKFGSEARARALFERAAAMRLSPKKMKAIFKKWLEFEAGPRGGGASAVESVKRKVRDWVAAQTESDNDDDDERA